MRCSIVGKLGERLHAIKLARHSRRHRRCRDRMGPRQHPDLLLAPPDHARRVAHQDAGRWTYGRTTQVLGLALLLYLILVVVPFPVVLH